MERRGAEGEQVEPQVYAVSEALIRIVLAERSVPAGVAGDMEPHEVRAAVHLTDRGEATIGELARASGITIGWASRIVDRLEQRGHIERLPDTRDRRVTRVRLTANARGLIERAYRWRGDVVARRLAALPATHRPSVVAFLRGVAEDLEAGPGRR